MLQLPQIIAIVIIVFIALMFMIARSKQPLYNDVMHGMWRGGEDFLEKSDLSGMYIYIGEPYNNNPLKDTRKAYIIMHSGDNILVNKRIELEITKSILETLSPFTKTELEQKVKVLEYNADDGSDDSLDGIVDESADTNQIPISDIMPEDLTMYLNMGTGRLSLKGNDPKTGEERLYAELYKDAAA